MWGWDSEEHVLQTLLNVRDRHARREQGPGKPATRLVWGSATGKISHQFPQVGRETSTDLRNDKFTTCQGPKMYVDRYIN